MTNNQLPADVQERIKADALKAYPEGEAYRTASHHNHMVMSRKGYIAGATAVHECARVLVDALEWIKKYGPCDELTVKFIDKQLEQWWGGKEKEPCDCSISFKAAHGKCHKCPD